MATANLFPGTVTFADQGTDGVPFVFATEFWVNKADCSLTKVRYMHPTVGNLTPRTMGLYRVDDWYLGTLLGSWTMPTPVAGAWCELTIPTPIPLVANQKYKICVLVPGGSGFARTFNYFDTGSGGTTTTYEGFLVRPRAADTSGGNQGTYAYNSATLTFPTGSYLNSSYYVDVEVSDAPANTPVTKTLQTSWNARSTSTASRSTTWNVRTQILQNRSSSWNVYGFIIRPVEISWNVRTSLLKTISTTWLLNASLLTSRSTSWNVQTLVPKTLSSLWTVQSLLQKSLETRWIIREILNRDFSISWNDLESIRFDKTILWMVRAQQIRDLSTLWNIQGPLVSSKTISWNVLRTIDKPLDILWSILQEVAQESSTTWNSEAQIQKALSIYWRTLSDLTQFWIWENGELIPITLEGEWDGDSIQTLSNTIEESA